MIYYLSGVEVALSKEVRHPYTCDVARGTVDEFDNPPNEPWRPLSRVPRRREVDIILMPERTSRQGLEQSKAEEREGPTVDSEHLATGFERFDHLGRS